MRHTRNMRLKTKSNILAIAAALDMMFEEIASKYNTIY